jgi:trimeric autotransporter adhesin
MVLLGCAELSSLHAANLVLVNAVAANKIYNGTTAATVDFSGAILVGVSNADLGNVTLVTSGYSATFDDKYVGSGKTVTVSGLTLAGSAAGNYTLTQPTLYADINPLPLTVTATGVNKTYNGSTNASVTLANNALTGDSVTAYYTTAGFSDKNVGTNKTVTVFGLIISGADSDSYTLTNSTVTTTANIAAKVLHVAATGVNKPYDATTNATVTLSDNHVAGDSITDTYTSAYFSDPTVGLGKTIGVTGIAVSGSDAPNYSLANTTATAQANITARTLNVSATGQNKTYDGTTNATVTLSDDRIAGDSLTVTFQQRGLCE